MDWRTRYKKHIISIKDIKAGMEIRYFSPFSKKDEDGNLIGEGMYCSQDATEHYNTIAETPYISAAGGFVEFTNGYKHGFTSSEFVEVLN